MDYDRIEFDGRDTVLAGVKHFVPEQTLDCGQCFRWTGSGGEYSGIAYGRRLEISFDGSHLTLRDTVPGEFESRWKNYFDFDRDYGEVRSRFSKDGALARAVDFSPGLRLMKQEPWEVLISFIFSQNNNIPRIKKIIGQLCECFGEPLQAGGYTFPRPEVLAVLDENALVPLKCGYRAEYITGAARLVAEGALNLNEIYTLEAEAARERLMGIKGVGPKVSDCVLLFGYGSLGCLPKDVWMKRVLTEYYPGGFPQEFSGEAGIAQQFLFHYARNGKKQN